MSQSVVPVHPQIKKIIQNLDLDLGLELNRYENSHLQESLLIADPIVEESILYHEKESNPQDTHSFLVYNPDGVDSEDPIPVASRLISDPSSLLDVILSPWGMIGIILFFGANIFIFFNLDRESLVNNNPESETSTNKIENQNPDHNLNLSNLEQTEDKTPNIDIQPPPLPTPLPEINNSNPINNSSENSSLYPDLKTALFAEIQKNQETLPSPSSNNTPTLPFPANNPPLENPPRQVPVNPPKPKVEQKYYLLSNYQNMDNFNRIKKVAPNALIMNLNQEMKIQLGIFNTETEAKNQAKKLQSRGIKIYVQPVNN